ncbi:hypothetical protein A6C57_04815 [Fibrella sp. ES10-3-2-2]|nr:hypothetical protein A6C57_04815 [Fibrella sp. ES10-3-2-2]
MLKRPAYFIAGYAVILFLIFRFDTDQEVPLYRILIRVAIASLLTFLFMRGFSLLRRSGN